MKRAELRKALQAAKSFKVSLAKDEKASEAFEAAKRVASIKLRAWYEEWSETARSVVKRRDFLIALGLAHRQSRVSEEAPGEMGEGPIPPLTTVAPPKRRRKR